jgi:hypothetical protein
MAERMAGIPVGDWLVTGLLRLQFLPVVSRIALMKKPFSNIHSHCRTKRTA